MALESPRFAISISFSKITKRRQVDPEKAISTPESSSSRRTD